MMDLFSYDTKWWITGMCCRSGSVCWYHWGWLSSCPPNRPADELSPPASSGSLHSFSPALWEAGIPRMVTQPGISSIWCHCKSVLSLSTGSGCWFYLTVDHQILLNRQREHIVLSLTGLPSLWQRVLCHFSKHCEITWGVLQGSILGRLLFNLYRLPLVVSSGGNASLSIVMLMIDSFFFLDAFYIFVPGCHKTLHSSTRTKLERVTLL